MALAQAKSRSTVNGAVLWRERSLERLLSGLGRCSGPRSQSTYSHLAPNISRSVAPVKISKRMTVTAWGSSLVSRFFLGMCLALGLPSSTDQGRPTVSALFKASASRCNSLVER